MCVSPPPYPITISQFDHAATRDCGEAAEKNIPEGNDRETLRLAGFADKRFCLSGQAFELAYGCSDDRSSSEELTQWC